MYSFSSLKMIYPGGKLEACVQRYQIQSVHPQVLLINDKSANASNVPLYSPNNG